jgi:hypothetical protein
MASFSAMGQSMTSLAFSPQEAAQSRIKIAGDSDFTPPADFNENGQLVGTWNPGGRLDPYNDDRTPLLSQSEGDATGEWTLILSDMGEAGAGPLNKWDRIITSVPEPSSPALIGLGGMILLLRLRCQSRRPRI